MDNNKLATELAEIIKSTKEFVVSQTPDVIQQMLFYNKVEAIAGLVFGIVLLFAALACVYAAIKKDEPVALVGTVIFGMISLILFIVNGFNLFSMIYTPKYYLLEQMKNLMH